MNREKLLLPLPAGKLPSWLLKKAIAPRIDDPDVIVGPGVGRDAAAMAVGDRIVVAKTDPITFASSGAAMHLIDVNANDIACMGAQPRWLLVTMLLPQGVTGADVLTEFAELREACRHRDIEIVGGHSEIMPDLAKPILMGAMLGVCNPDELLHPGGSRAGDALLLTKGLAIEGTALLAKERAEVLCELLGEQAVAAAARLLKFPGISIVEDAQVALSAGGVTALHDPTEGGLASAIRELAAVSGLGARVKMEKVPILPETTAVATAFGLDPLGMLASGSLLLAVDPKSAPETINALAAAGIPAARIGVLTEDPHEFILEREGDAAPLPAFAVDEVARLFSAEQASTSHQENT